MHLFQFWLREGFLYTAACATIGLISLDTYLSECASSAVLLSNYAIAQYCTCSKIWPYMAAPQSNFYYVIIEAGCLDNPGVRIKNIKRSSDKWGRVHCTSLTMTEC